MQTKGNLSRSLTMLAYALAEKFRWEVKFGTQGPCIDMKTRTVYLPRAWVGGSASDAQLLMGLFYHEVLGHGIATDPDLPCGGPSVCALEAGLRNVLEDIRIERAASRTYVGVSRGLAETVVEMRNRDLWQKPAPQAQEDPGTVLVMGLCHILRSQHLCGQAATLGTWAQLWQTKGARLFGRNLWDRILAIANRISTARLDLAGTRESQALAAQITALLKQAQSNPEQFAKESPKQKTRPLDNGDAAGEGSGDGEGNGSPDRPGNKPNDAGKSSGSAGSQKKGDETSRSTATSRAPSPEMIAKAAAGALAASSVPEIALEKMLGQAIEHAVGGSAGGFGTYSEVSRTRLPDPYADLFAGAATILARNCGRDIERLLESQSMEKRWYTATGMQLAANRLARIAVADARVFRRREDAEGVSTAVALLIDVSGSMDNAMPGWSVDGQSSMKHMAISTGYAMGRLLDRFGARWALGVFATRFSLIKSLSESTPQCRFYREGKVGGGTSTAEAIIGILPRLGLAEERKKLLILVTDGEPNNEANAIAAIRECYRYDVQVLTLLIGGMGSRFQATLKREGLPFGRCSNATAFREAVATAIARAALLGMDLRATRKVA